MHADDHFGLLFPRLNRNRVVEILRIDRVDGDRQLPGAVLTGDLARLKRQRLLIVRLPVGRSKIVFRNDRVEIGGNHAGAPHHLVDRAFQFADIGFNIVCNVFDYFLVNIISIHFFLLMKNCHSGFVIRQCDICDQAPFKS